MIDQEPVVTRTLLKTADRIPTTAKIFGLSFQQEPWAHVCAEQYYLLREFALSHPESVNIFRAID